MKRRLVAAVLLALLSAGWSSAATEASAPPPEPRAVNVWNIWRPGACFSQDYGGIYREPGFDRYLLYYGAVTDKSGAHSCVSTGYSEDIWLTWSMSDGYEFGQNAAVDPPLRILSSKDFADKYGKGPGGCETCTGWHIGDSAVTRGPETLTYYLFFDAQSCADAAAGTWAGLFVAASASAFHGFEIQGAPPLAGRPPFHFARTFKDPTNGRMYLYYRDATTAIRVARVNDDGVGLDVVMENDARPVIPALTANVVSPYYADGAYYAVADNFGSGHLQDLRTLWLLGPSATPFTFDWDARKAILRAGSWYAHSFGFPSTLSPAATTDRKPRIYFWGSAGDGDSCGGAGATSAGALLREFPQAPLKRRADPWSGTHEEQALFSSSRN
ncbi:MAG: hypothetical protein HY553_12920 [Elusimicrobia bacterium]|nr:hypothetical protein [Elusimicrobiota bacterium]